jgi:hypothetical protein
MNVEIRAVGQTKADAGDIVAKLMLSELHVSKNVRSRLSLGKKSCHLVICT